MCFTCFSSKRRRENSITLFQLKHMQNENHRRFFIAVNSIHTFRNRTKDETMESKTNHAQSKTKTYHFHYVGKLKHVHDCGLKKKNVLHFLLFVIFRHFEQFDRSNISVTHSWTKMNYIFIYSIAMFFWCWQTNWFFIEIRFSQHTVDRSSSSIFRLRRLCKQHWMTRVAYDSSPFGVINFWLGKFCRGC